MKSRIKKIIDERCGGDLKTFADTINAGKSTVQSWNEKSIPSGRFLDRIRQFFGVNINWFLTGTGEPYLVNARDDLRVELCRTADKKGMWGETERQEVGGKAFTVTSFEPKETGKSDPFVSAIAGLKDIFDRGDDTLKAAISANIDAFKMSSLLVQRVRQMNDRIDRMEQMIQAILDKHLTPEGKEERRDAFIQLRQVITNN